MRILIAGWHGQIAKALVDRAPRCSDIAACAVGRPALDICEARTIERALAGVGPDIVINAAAYTAVDKAESEPDRAFALNRDGARLLAHAAAKRGVPIIHLSTDRVFDGLKVGPYVETDAVSPQGVYGRSKLEGEAAVRDANPRHIILRTTWVFSTAGRNFVKNILEQAAQGKRLQVVDDQRGSPTYAPHLADAIIEIGRQIRAKGAGESIWGIYNAAGTGAATWYGLACEALRRSRELNGPTVPVEPIAGKDYPTVAPRAANAVLDCTKLARVFGTRLPAWEEGVAHCVAGLLTPPAATSS
jgi:dTDP-4-dehydrorhamnose reductase